MGALSVLEILGARLCRLDQPQRVNNDDGEFQHYPLFKLLRLVFDTAALLFFKITCRVRFVWLFFRNGNRFP